MMTAEAFRFESEDHLCSVRDRLVAVVAMLSGAALRADDPKATAAFRLAEEALGEVCEMIDMLYGAAPEPKFSAIIDSVVNAN